MHSSLWSSFPILFLTILTLIATIFQGYEPDSDVMKACMEFAEEVLQIKITLNYCMDCINTYSLDYITTSTTGV